MSGAILRLLGRRGEMRRRDDVVELKQRAGVRFRGEDVERSGRDLARLQRLQQRVLVDELTARGVDEPGAVAELGEHLSADRSARLVRQRRVQRDEVGGGVELVGSLRTLDGELAETLFRDEGVMRHDAHLEPERPPRDLLVDAPEARPLPASLRERRVRLRDVARESEQEADRVLGSGDDRRLGRVRNDDAPTRGGFDVDVVDPDAGAADHLQLLGAFDQVLRQLRRRADDDPVVAADDLGEIGVAVLVDLEMRAEQLDARVRDLFANEDLHTRTGWSYASSARVTATPRSRSAPSSVSASSTAASAVVMSKTSK